jgi:hypothetical protein
MKVAGIHFGWVAAVVVLAAVWYFNPGNIMKR